MQSVTLSALEAPAANGAGDAQTWRDGIVTRSPAMEKLLALARRVALSEAAVCIYGASGTGKELLARSIHRAGSRAAAPFVALNCGAIPGEQLESELFGHRKGAVSGAIQDRRGVFQAAQGGTLFLDEIGELPPALQAKLLRALEEGAIRPLGAGEEVAVDARIICATQRRLEQRIASGEFREDLYYRLNVVKLDLPTLAERREDIPPLVALVLARLAAQYRRPRLAMSPEAMDLLVAAPWPGNVRQLLSVLEQVVALSSADWIPASALRQALGDAPQSLTPLDEARRAFERDYLVRILKITAGNVTRAARLAGRNRTEFYRLLERHGLTPRMFKPSPKADEANHVGTTASGGDA